LRCLTVSWPVCLRCLTVSWPVCLCCLTVSWPVCLRCLTVSLVSAHLPSCKHMSVCILFYFNSMFSLCLFAFFQSAALAIISRFLLVYCSLSLGLRAVV